MRPVFDSSPLLHQRVSANLKSFIAHGLKKGVPIGASEWDPISDVDDPTVFVSAMAG